MRIVIRWKGREREVVGHGHHLILSGKVVYVCPVLILHYILEHGYAPPEEFIAAVTEGTFVTLENELEAGFGWSFILQGLFRRGGPDGG